MSAHFSYAHRNEMLRFLLVKTATVRCGVKPGELLRIRHCYQPVRSGAFPFCLRKEDILDILQLDFIVLREEAQSSLILFYHREMLEKTLTESENRTLLTRCGYGDGTVEEMLARLVERFQWEQLPHEVGIFLGYPAKDVSGFLGNESPTPVHRGDWQVFGDAAESVRRMHLYRSVREAASRLLDCCEDVPTFLEQFSFSRNVVAN